MSEPNNVVKVSEEDLYAAALAEVQSGTTRPGLWAKAFADSEGDENKSKALYIKLRVQQEIEHQQQQQKDADALAAESVRQKASEFQSVLDQLFFFGYGVKRTATGWAVREPLGGRVKFDSDKSLLEYAQRHVAVSPELFEWLRTHEVFPEVRDGFNSKSAERTNEKSEQPSEIFAKRKPIPRVLYEAVIGEKNRDYYVTKFEQFDQHSAGLKASWNWASFMAGIYWVVYRKMYAWLFFFLGVAFLSGFFDSMTASNPSNTITAWLGAIFILVPLIAFAIFADSLYHNHVHVKKKIAAAQLSINDETELLRFLRYKGGVNLWVVWVGIALPVIGILAAILIPSMIQK